ncbi:flagellar basal-body rod protein FlgG [Vulgatibacter sp.]|uniref:flagellar basal-body rod protein FlgG n=1 Tax=Vulgatibacter sp. TaxID=1971226 RepID=UPI0035628600
MLRSLYTAATGMEAQELKMDVVSNNLANASTTGFKRVRAEFEDLLSETLRAPQAPAPEGGSAPAPLQVGLGVRTGATTRDFGQGDLIATGNSLDVAIEGAGFFRVVRPDGELAYSRAGNFRVDAAGRLVTQRGELVEPGIDFPPDVVEITIQADGAILARSASATAAAEVGTLELSTFVNPGGLLALGGNLFAASEASGEAIHLRPGEQGAGMLAQGHLEGANVKAVEEMIDLIATQRAYELNSKVIQTADQMLQRLTSLR